MTTGELAKLVIETLDAQRAYFRSRNAADLEVSKRLERILRKQAEDCLNAQRQLFGEDQ